MKNAIIYYYNLKTNEVHQNANYYWFKVSEKMYYLYKTENNNIDELLEIVNILLKNNIRIHIPIYNQQKSLLTNINGINYILFEIIVNSKEPIILNDIYEINKIVIDSKERKKASWYDLWSEKIDYLELQISEFGKEYPLLRKSFPYFCGLAETAIQLLDIIDVKEYRISHRYISKDEHLEEFLNPLNMTIDLKTRDLSEYLKSNYNHLTGIEDITYIIKKFNLSNEEIKLLFARTLFPNYYFNMFEEIIAGEKEEKYINKYIENANTLEYLLKVFYSYIKKIVEIPTIDYLEYYLCLLLLVLLLLLPLIIHLLKLNLAFHILHRHLAFLHRQYYFHILQILYSRLHS